MAAHPLTPSSVSARVSLAAFGAITLVLMSVGYWYYRTQVVELIRDKHEALSAIGERKALQLVQWRKERQMDAYRLAHGFTANALEDFLSRPDDAKLRDTLHARLKLEVESGDAVEALLLSPDGAILAAAGESPQQIAPALHRAIEAALASQEVVFSEFYRVKNGTAVYVDAVEAIRDAEGRPLAVVAIRNDASSYLFPMIQSWPLPSRSAETLLVQRDGEEVIYLNKLRHRDGSAPAMREPLSRLDLPAAQAVLGKRGIFEGKDYRGVPVLSDLHASPHGFSWPRWI